MYKSTYFSYFINVFIFINLLLPKFILTKIFFFIIFFSYLLIRPKIILKRYLIFISIYLYSIVIGILRDDVDTSILFQFINFALILSLISPILEFKIEIDKIIILSSIFISFINLSILLSSFGIININFFDFVLNYNSFAVGTRSFDENKVSLVAFATLGTTPILTLAYFIVLKNKNTFLILFFGFIILLSSSRAMILTVAILTIYFMFKNFNFIYKFIFLTISLFFSIQYFASLNFFSTEEFGNNTRIGHFNGFLNYINTFNFIFGSGLTSSYTSDSYGITNHTEITILDDIRYFGFPLTCLIYFLYIYPSNKLAFSELFKMDYFYFFLIYLLMSLTNPILTNSMGVIVILWYWNSCLKNTYYEIIR
jgi:hypothetical protein